MLGIILMYNYQGPDGWERVVHWVHWGHKKTGHIGPVHLFTNLLDYLATTESALISATVESVADTAVESNTTAVESAVPSDVPLPPHAVKAAIAKIAITFFIFLCLLFKLNCLLLL